MFAPKIDAQQHSRMTSVTLLSVMFLTLSAHAVVCDAKHQQRILLLFSIHQLAVRFASVFMCQIISRLLHRFFVQICFFVFLHIWLIYFNIFFCKRRIFKEKKTIEVKMKTKYNVSLEHTYLGPVYSVEDRFHVSILLWFRLNSAKLMRIFFLI